MKILTRGSEIFLDTRKGDSEKIRGGGGGGSKNLYSSKPTGGRLLKN